VIERLRSATPEEGSWVSMAFDPRGRVVVAREERGLLRMTLPAGGRANGQSIEVETIDDTLLECRGLLFAFGDLFINANNSKGLYRLRDTDGDDHFDETKLLYHSPGGVGHGRNDLVLGPDDMIYSIHGDAVDLPQTVADATSPFREHRRGLPTHEGHVIRIDREGQRVELFAAGLRNPFGIDFNPDGEPFTYDADAEYDMGAPWYRPTRVVHLVRGGDYGWRGVTGSWPPYYPDHPDSALPNLDIGKGSPTAVKFGTRSNFPPPLQQALFILDWAYGRILAVHMTPHGASYLCRAETFLKGRPLNVTDLDFGPDGAMYFVTGGRKTQSALYRVRYVGATVESPPPSEQELLSREAAAQQRQLRRDLESLDEQKSPQAVDIAWPHLDSSDPWIRQAARIAVEHQPLEAWRARALAENLPTAAATALLALARCGDTGVMTQIVERLCELSLGQLETDNLLSALYTVKLCLDGGAKLPATLQDQLTQQLDALYPHRLPAVNQRLSTLLVQLDAPDFTAKTLQALSEASSQAERMHYLFVLRRAPNWTRQQRLQYIAGMRRSESFQGGEGMPKFRQQIRADWLSTLSADERREFEPLLEERAPPAPAVVERPFVKSWQLDDLARSLSDVSGPRDLNRGKEMFTAALCTGCHRVGLDGAAIGPDLTSVSRRFSRRDILESILAPSKVVAEPYRTVRITTDDGRVISGQILPSSDYRSPNLRIATNQVLPGQIIELPKSHIESHEISPQSPMPEGLLNTLSQDEILDLLAYLASGI
jgi:putative heme-binding domain-containing protein